jgi:hypothetical protein
MIIYFTIDYSSTFEIEGPHIAKDFAEMERREDMLEDEFMQEDRNEAGIYAEVRMDSGALSWNGDPDLQDDYEATRAQIEMCMGKSWGLGRYIDGDGWGIAYMVNPSPSELTEIKNLLSDRIKLIPIGSREFDRAVLRYKRICKAEAGKNIRF